MTRQGRGALTSAQAEAFRRDGVVCLRGVLTGDEIALLRAGVSAQMQALGRSETGYDFEIMALQAWEGRARIEAGAANRFDLAGLPALLAADPAARPLQDPGAEAPPGLFFYDAAGWREQAGIRAVAFDSALPELAAGLMNAECVQFWEDTTFVKSPHTRQKTAFHQDLGYFQIEGDQCLIAWVPLDPAGEWNGVTRYVRGSHLWGDVYAPNIFISQTPFPGAEGPRCPDIEADPSAYDLISFEVMPGDVIFHHVRTVHGAGGNASDSWRRAMSFRYCGEEVRYFSRPGALPPIGDHARHCDGDRLSPDSFPVVWPRP